MNYRIQDGKWEIHGTAAETNSKVREQLGSAEHAEYKRGLQQYLVNYFNSDHRSCSIRVGDGICPVGLSDYTGRGKCLKVRWPLPGAGKSGGLRLLVIVYCNDKRVKIVGAWARKTEPAIADLEAAAVDH